MLRFLISVFCIGLFSTFYGQHNNLKEANLRGSVKSVKMNHKKFIVENDSLIEIDVAYNDPFGFKGFIDDYLVFNKDGMIIE